MSTRRAAATALTLTIAGGGLLGVAAPASAQAVPSACDAVADNLVENCGFESDIFDPWTTTRAGTGSRLTASVANPHTGTRAADFAATFDDDDTLTQVIPAAQPNTTYTLSYWLANGDTVGDDSFTASVSGVDAPGGTTTLERLSDAEPFGYTQRSYEFTTAAELSGDTPLTLDLAFAGRNFDASFTLDDVVLTAEPTPPPAGSGTADLRTRLDAPRVVERGTTYDTTVTVTNTGDSPAARSYVTLATFGVGEVIDDGGATVSGGRTVLTVPSLAVGGSVTLTVTFRAPDRRGFGLATGVGTSRTPDPRPLNNVQIRPIVTR